MRINKTITKSVTYYECQINENQFLFAFTLRALIVDLCKIYGFSLFRPLNLN